MPDTGYDEEAMRIGKVRRTRPRWPTFVVFVIAIAVGAGVASLFK